MFAFGILGRSVPLLLLLQRGTTRLCGMSFKLAEDEGGWDAPLRTATRIRFLGSNVPVVVPDP
jgi:hypothetical protein